MIFDILPSTPPTPPTSCTRAPDNLSLTKPTKPGLMILLSGKRAREHVSRVSFECYRALLQGPFSTPTLQAADPFRHYPASPREEAAYVPFLPCLPGGAALCAALYERE